MRSDYDFLDEFLSANSITVLDIGARGGSLEELEPFRKYIAYIGFDADAEVANRLNSSAGHGFKSLSVYPLFIGGTVCTARPLENPSKCLP